jgi:hypothetical protein
VIRFPKLTLAALFLFPFAAVAAPAAKVTNGNDAGPGSLRQALIDKETKIVIVGSVGTITLNSTLVYEGTEPLKIIGSGQTIDGTATGQDPVLEITMGADLTVSNLTFDGGDSLTQWDMPAGGKGVFVNVPTTRTGTVKVDLSNVAIMNTGNHGLHVSDCTDGDDCGEGEGSGGDGSTASVYVKLNSVLVDSAGIGIADRDGVRVDERNEGDITLAVTNSTFVNAGADGLELDEGNNGDVFVDVRNSTFDNNGDFCNLGPVPGEDDPCFDEFDDEGVVVVDVVDGFDVDEAGAGTFYGVIRNTNVTNNKDEGLDFDEQGSGGISIDLIGVYAEANVDQGIKLSEEDDGDVIATLRGVVSQNNDDLTIEEENAGDLEATVTGSTINETLEVEQEQEPGDTGTLKVRGSSISAIAPVNVIEI